MLQDVLKLTQEHLNELINVKLDYSITVSVRPLTKTIEARFYSISKYCRDCDTETPIDCDDYDFTITFSKDKAELVSKKLKSINPKEDLKVLFKDLKADIVECELSDDCSFKRTNTHFNELIETFENIEKTIETLNCCHERRLQEEEYRYLDNYYKQIKR